MTTLGDILIEAAKNLGVDTGSDAMKKLLADTAYATPVSPETFPQVWENTVMTFSTAKNNPGLKSHFEKTVNTENSYGTFAEMQERALTPYLKDMGMSEVEISEFYSRTRGQQAIRMPELMKLVQEKVKPAPDGNGGTGKAEEYRQALERVTLDLQNKQREWEAQTASIKSEYEAQIQSVKNEILSRDLNAYVRKSIPFNSEIPGLDFVISGKLSELGNRYHIAPGDNGGFELRDKANPGEKATNTNTGQHLVFDNVLADLFGPEFLKNKNEGGGNGNSNRRETTGPEERKLSRGLEGNRDVLADARNAIKGQG